MKLLLFIGAMRSGGAERVMATLSNEFANRNHEVTLATMLPYESFYELNDKVKQVSLYRTNNATLVQKIIWRLKWYRYIRKTVKQEKPDIIVSFIWGLNAPVLLSTRFLNIPVIASEHTTFNKKKSLYEKWCRFYVNRLADKVTILTKYDYDYIGNRLKNKMVIPNPLSFDPYLPSSTKERKKCIIAAGGIDRYYIKGFDNLIKIWGKIAHKYPDWVLQIAGAGTSNNINILKVLAQQNNIVNQIEFIGPIKALDLKLRESSIFVLSSRFEGLPMVLIEAMSQGCACVSFDCITGPREIITNNIDGLLIQNQNLDEMREAICKLIENDKKREYLSKNALISVQKFAVNKIVDKWERLFSELSKSY